VTEEINREKRGPGRGGDRYGENKRLWREWEKSRRQFERKELTALKGD